MFSSNNRKCGIRMGLSRNYKKKTQTVETLLEKTSASTKTQELFSEASMSINTKDSPTTPEAGRSHSKKSLRKGFGAGVFRPFKSPMLSYQEISSPITRDTKVETITKPASAVLKTLEIPKHEIKDDVKTKSKILRIDRKVIIQEKVAPFPSETTKTTENIPSPMDVDSLIIEPIITPVLKSETSKKTEEKTSASTKTQELSSEASMSTNIKDSPATPEAGRSHSKKSLGKGFGASVFRPFKSPMLSYQEISSPITRDTKVETITKPASAVLKTPEIPKHEIKDNVKNPSKILRIDRKVRIQEKVAPFPSETTKTSENIPSPMDVDNLINEPIITPVLKSETSKKTEKLLSSKQMKDKKSSRKVKSTEIIDIQTTDKTLSIASHIGEKFEETPKAQGNIKTIVESNEVNPVKRKLVLSSESDSDIEPLSKIKEKIDTSKKSFTRKINKKLSSRFSLKSNTSSTKITSDSEDDFLIKPKIIRKMLSNTRSSNSFTSQFEKLPIESQELNDKQLDLQEDKVTSLEITEEAPEISVEECEQMELSLKSNRSSPIKEIDKSSSSQLTCVKREKSRKFQGIIAEKSNKQKVVSSSDSDSDFDPLSKIKENMDVDKKTITRKLSKKKSSRLLLNSNRSTPTLTANNVTDSEDDFLIKPKIIRKITSNSSITSQNKKLPLESQKLKEELQLNDNIKVLEVIEEAPDILSSPKEVIENICTQEIALETSVPSESAELFSTPHLKVLSEDINSLRKAAINLDLEVQSMEKHLEQLKHAKVFRAKQSLEDIKKDAKTWKDGCVETLRDLLKLMQERSPITMAVMIQQMKVPSEILKYDEVEDCFHYL